MNNPKSSTIAGVFGITLGALGVHNWYLGEQKKAKRHIILLIVGAALVVASMLMRALLPVAAQATLRTTMGNVAAVLQGVGWLVIIADVVWGIIEGILLLMQGGSASAYQQSTSSTSSADQPTTDSTQSAPPQSPPTPGTSQTHPQPPLDHSQPSSQPPHAQPVTTTSQPSNTQPAAISPQPNLTFTSSNIQNPTFFPQPDQAIGTKDVEAPPLAITQQDGKEKLNPVVKRWLLSSLVVVIALAILGLLIKGGVDSIMASAYGETYRAAKEIKPLIEKAHDSQACEYVVQYVKVAYVDRRTYAGYIDTCEALTQTDIITKIDQLGTTPILRWNAEIMQDYEKFQAAYIAAFPSDIDLTSALHLYQTWHDYVIATDALTLESSDYDLQAAADILRTSGNSALAQYGELWLEKELAYVNAYRTYQNTSYTSPEKETTRQNYEALRTNLQDWVADHRPDVTKIEPLPVPGTDAMYDSFMSMYNQIKTGYEEHYDRNSGDCNDSGRTVYCN